MPAKRNPLNLNALQLKTLTLLQELARIAGKPAAAEEGGGVAITELPDERRIVVVLCDFEGLSYEEIAAALNLPLGTVRSRLHRARTDLKEKLERFLP